METKSAREKSDNSSSSSLMETYSGRRRISVNCGRSMLTQLNMNLKKFDAKYTADGTLRIEESYHEIESNLETQARNTIRQIAEHVTKHKGASLSEEVEERYEDIFTDISISKRPPERVSSYQA